MPELETIVKGAGSRIEVRLTAGAAPLFYNRDDTTKLVPYQIQILKGKGWENVDDSLWQIKPEQPAPQIKPGRSIRFEMDKPKLRRKWRVGVLVYPRAPAHGVPSAMIWSAPVSP